MEKQLLPGMFDIVPEDPKDLFRSSHLWQFLEEKIRKLCRAYGFEEIRTPLLEKAALFLRTSGETSDVISKELYDFIDKGERHLALRPEGTASALRAYIEQPQDWQKAHSKLFYIAPMFRYDRPQAGRYRQHHQFGVESIGSKTPESDAEMIDFLYTLYKEIGIQTVELHINSLGTESCRKNYIEALKNYYIPLESKLSEDSKRRLLSNPLRILDSKDPQDIAFRQHAPSILDYLSDESKQYFEELKKWLDKLGIPYKVNPNLVRGLDYYNHTVFEIIAGALGAQNSIGGGGRYDGLMKKLGGPDLPAFGFGTGLERVLQTLISTEVPLPQAPKAYIVFIPLGEQATEKAILLAKKARLEQIPCEVDLSRKKVGKMVELAHAKGAKYIGVIGDQELAENSILLKEMDSGVETKVSFDNLIRTIQFDEELPYLLKQWEKAYQLLNDPALAQRFLGHLDTEIQSTGNSLKAIQDQVLEIKKTLY